MTNTESSQASAAGNPAPLLGDIQSGRTGDKVAGFDPAAAPLGVDDEAAGQPPSQQQVEQARAQERAPAAKPAPNGATPELQPNARLSSNKGMAIGALLGVGAAVALGALLLAAL